MQNYKISASVVVYNKIDDVYKTLKSINDYTEDNFNLYVIDNNSKEKIANEMEKEFKRFNYIKLEENIGFGKAHNKVLEEIDSDYHFVINPDILINENTIKSMCDFMNENNDVVISCPKVLNQDNSIQYIAKNRPTLLSLISRRIPLKFLKKIEDEYLMKDKNQEDILEVDFCTGCFFVIRTEVLKKIKGFDKDYFLYFEDADITMKAKKYGKAIYYPKASVIHFWHRETKSSIKQFLIQLKSMMIYFKKWGFKLK